MIKFCIQNLKCRVCVYTHIFRLGFTVGCIKKYLSLSEGCKNHSEDTFCLWFASDLIDDKIAASLKRSRNFNYNYELNELGEDAFSPDSNM